MCYEEQIKAHMAMHRRERVTVAEMCIFRGIVIEEWSGIIAFLNFICVYIYILDGSGI